MLQMSNTGRLLAYLDAYARKDLVAVGTMFADDVTLRDWNLAVRGKAAALAETAKNFSAAGALAIEALGIYADGDTVAAELTITIDGQVDLRVVDVISFDRDGRIRSIRAYLGRAGE